MQTKKLVVVAVFTTLLVTLYFSFRTEPSLALKKTYRISGTVAEVSQAGTDDVVVKLQNDDDRYFIERGLKNGLTVSALRRELTGKPVEIHYVKNRFVFTSFKHGHYVAKVAVDKTVFYPVVSVSR